MNNEAVSVAAILPFWRYAVGPISAMSPAIPFYRRVSAEAFFEKAKRELPFSGVVLYRRMGWNGIDEIKRHTPDFSALNLI